MGLQLPQAGSCPRRVPPAPPVSDAQRGSQGVAEGMMGPEPGGGAAGKGTHCLEGWPRWDLAPPQHPQGVGSSLALHLKSHGRGDDDWEAEKSHHLREAPG